jgi:DNA-binding PadR family transcriptional regulator
VEIEERSSGSFRFNHGTLYPILHKLEAWFLILNKVLRVERAEASSLLE